MSSDIIFEVIPYSKTASGAHCQKFVERVAGVLDEMKHVGMLNIPEILEENHMGQPYYRNIDSREFGARLREKCKKNIGHYINYQHHLKSMKH